MRSTVETVVSEDVARLRARVDADASPGVRDEWWAAALGIDAALPSGHAARPASRELLWAVSTAIRTARGDRAPDLGRVHLALAAVESGLEVRPGL